MAGAALGGARRVALSDWPTTPEYVSSIEISALAQRHAGLVSISSAVYAC